LLQQGAENLKTEELIAILLRTGTKGTSALEAAAQLLGRFNHSLDTLSRVSVEEIRSVKGIGRDKAVTLKAAFTLAQRVARQMAGEAPLLDTPGSVADFLREDHRDCQVETTRVVLLNTRRRLIRVEKLADGILDSALVHPREVFRPAIAANAAAIVLVHNHPSGDPTPSEADVKITRDLIRAAQLLKIDFLDHLILGRRTESCPRDYASLRELGYFAP